MEILLTSLSVLQNRQRQWRRACRGPWCACLPPLAAAAALLLPRSSMPVPNRRRTYQLAGGTRAWGGAADFLLPTPLCACPPATWRLQLPGDEEGYQLFLRPYKGEVEFLQRIYPEAAVAAARELAAAAAEHAAAEAAAAAAAAAEASAKKRKRKAAAAALERATGQQQKKQRKQQLQQQKLVPVRLPPAAGEGEPDEVLVGCSLFCMDLPTPEPDAQLDADAELRQLLG